MASEESQVAAVVGFQSAIRSSLAAHLDTLTAARAEHSHSDLLLPSDVVPSVLEGDSDQLKALIDSFVQQGDAKSGEAKDVINSILGIESRQLVFAALHDDESMNTLARPQTKDLFDRLDVVLQLDRQDLIDTSLPLLIHEEVLDRLPIIACSQQFEYIEVRIHDLTKGLQPGRGKGLTLLRFCIELVRRLSKPTREHTIFVGRILSLLSSVFPLGERSGVNFRGDFNVDNKTTWEETLAGEEEGNDAVKKDEDEGQTDDPDAAKDETARDDEIAEESGFVIGEIAREDLLQAVDDPIFYSLFWTAQSWFSNPALLFDNGDDQMIRLPKAAIDPVLAAASSTTMKTFRTATNLILKVLGAVGRREKELEGKADKGKPGEDTSDSASLRTSNGRSVAVDAGVKKRKRDVQAVDDERDEGRGREDDQFFPKYLTDRDLFEYELRDAAFRRHVLAQYLILFQYLLSFTPAQKDRTKEWKNQLVANASSAFTLNESDEKWVREIWREVVGLIRETPPEGRVFSDTLLQVLRREGRWTQWKADNCPSIDQTPLSLAQLNAFSRARKPYLQSMRSYPHTMGTAALSRLWEDGVRKPEPGTRMIENEEGMEVQIPTDGLDDLEFGPTIPTLQSYAGQIAKVEQQQDARRVELDWESPQVYTITTLIPPEKRAKEKERLKREDGDDKLRDLDQQRILHAWRAARLARGIHLDSFARMKTDDGKSTGLRIDDITRLMKAVDDRGKPVKKVVTVTESENQLAVAPSSASSVPASVLAVSTPASPANFVSTKEEDVEMNDAAAPAPLPEGKDEPTFAGGQEEAKQQQEEVA